MRAAEFMRALADLIDKLDGNDTDEQSETETTTFVPPLQQKIELLKKSSGVQSVFDQADDDGPFED